MPSLQVAKITQNMRVKFLLILIPGRPPSTRIISKFSAIRSLLSLFFVVTPGDTVKVHAVVRKPNG